MSYVIDGDLSQAIQLPDELTGAVFGPDISRAYVGTETALKAKITELELDRRGVGYQLTRQGTHPCGSSSSSSRRISQPTIPVTLAGKLTLSFPSISSGG